MTKHKLAGWWRRWLPKRERGYTVDGIFAFDDRGNPIGLVNDDGELVIQGHIVVGRVADNLRAGDAVYFADDEGLYRRSVEQTETEHLVHTSWDGESHRRDVRQNADGDFVGYCNRCGRSVHWPESYRRVSGGHIICARHND